jgi:hypothetical protein
LSGSRISARHTTFPSAASPSSSSTMRRARELDCPGCLGQRFSPFRRVAATLLFMSPTPACHPPHTAGYPCPSGADMQGNVCTTREARSAPIRKPGRRCCQS